MWLISLLKSGVASFSTSGIEAINARIEEKRIEIDLMNKELLKDLLKSNSVKEISFLSKFTIFKNFAQELKKEGYTLTISYKGSLVLTLGSEAKPTLSMAITGTDSIEINNLKQLKDIIV